MDISKSIENLKRYLKDGAIVITKRNEFYVNINMCRILKAIKRGYITPEEVKRRIEDGS